jgi:hypothetical protein
MKPRARTEKQADAAGFEQGTIGRVTLSMGVAVAQEVESLDCPSAGGPLLRSQRAQDGRRSDDHVNYRAVLSIYRGALRSVDRRAEPMRSAGKQVEKHRRRETGREGWPSSPRLGFA